jgi:peptidoglycan/xylan/chitin deacetylase (PgdA/CDA1 family)
VSNAPITWPGGAECVVVVTVDVDGDLPFLALDPAHRDRRKSRSVGQYGPDHGADRLRTLFAELGVPATWFLPGRVAQRHPVLVERLHAAGADLASHGTAHLDFDGLDLAAQIDEILGGRDALQAVTGAPVRGFRIPAGEWRPGFVRAMTDEGFTWSSSLPGDDRPFWLDAEGGALEIPFRYELEDLQYLGFNLDPPFPPGQSRIASHRTVFENWSAEFAAARRWGTLLLLRLNAEVMGTPGRAALLRRLLGEMQQHDVWFATCAQVRERWEGVPLDHDHPYQRFQRIIGADDPAVVPASA